MHFRDRRDAGRMLAAVLGDLEDEQPVILAVPRGGVPVAYEVAHALHAPLEILAVRKLGAPRNPELGVGAIAEGGTTVIDRRAAAAVGMTVEILDETVAREACELERRVEHYRTGRAMLPLTGRATVIIDDGLATGLSDLAAVRAARARGARTITVAVPVGSSESIDMLAREADGVVCLITPRVLFGVGLWYEDFAPVDDEEVVALLSRACGDERAAPPEG